MRQILKVKENLFTVPVEEVDGEGMVNQVDWAAALAKKAELPMEETKMLKMPCRVAEVGVEVVVPVVEV